MMAFKKKPFDDVKVSRLGLTCQWRYNSNELLLCQYEHNLRNTTWHCVTKDDINMTKKRE